MTDSTTTARKLLREYHITDMQIARASICDRLTVRAVLDPQRFNLCKPLFVHMVRQKSIELLRAMGWTGDPANLWAEYDNTVNNEQEAA